MTYSALKIFLLCGLVGGIFCQGFSSSIPSSVQILTGSCVFVPCTFTLDPYYDYYLDDTCAVVWKSLDTYTEVFHSKRTKEESAKLNLLQGNVVGNVLEKNCSTILEPKSSEYAGSYYFSLQCYRIHLDFLKTFVRWDFPDSVPKPTIKPTTLEVMEGTTMALKCQAPVFCPTSPPLLTWAPELGTVKEEVDANVTAVMTFDTTYLHDNVDVTCSAVYRRQEGYAELSTEQALMLRVKYAPKDTSVSASPPGSWPDGSTVTLKCNGVANPPITDVNWYRVNNRGATLVGSGKEITFIATKLSEDSYYCENHNIHGAQSAEPLTVDVTFAPEFLSTSDCQAMSNGIQCSCISQANPPPSLQWKLLGVLVENSNQQTVTEQSLDKFTRKTVIIFKSLDSGTSLVCVSHNQFGPDLLAFNVPHSDVTTVVCSVVGVLVLLILILLLLYIWKKPEFNFPARWRQANRKPKFNFPARWRQANTNTGDIATTKSNVSHVDNISMTKLRSLHSDQVQLHPMGSDLKPEPKPDPEEEKVADSNVAARNSRC
ncbi:myelin-associated glycoprotein-like [Corythoichthys intestinalis]|uniref:myelin-associated glycoprotein-like n=1 Tax=Corythoichthys intestinalis TaxID=161448 RepID=UPI0025A62D1C|nr:myelin-associated glycoprotein-like [Corythoichthys intestinalis]